MKIIKLLGNNSEVYTIPLSATAISEVLDSEIECQVDDLDDVSDKGDDLCVATLSLTWNKEITPAALAKVAEFLRHYVDEEMTPFGPPFESETISSIVKEQWYADFITVDVDHDLLLEILAAANFLVRIKLNRAFLTIDEWHILFAQCVPIQKSIQPLLKLTALAISIKINGKKASEIRPMFGISNNLDDLQEKERVRAENDWAAEIRRQYEERNDAPNGAAE